jgi:hypothetical protein
MPRCSETSWPLEWLTIGKQSEISTENKSFKQMNGQVLLAKVF